MPRYEIFRVEDSAEAHSFDSIISSYLTLEEGAYVFHDLNRKHAPDAVYPIRHFRVAKIE